MTPFDTLAPLAIHVLIVLGLLLLVVEVVGAWRRRRDPWRELARRDRERGSVEAEVAIFAVGLLLIVTLFVTANRVTDLTERVERLERGQTTTAVSPER